MKFCVEDFRAVIVNFVEAGALKAVDKGMREMLPYFLRILFYFDKF